LREYVDRGGTILAEACCGNPEFDRAFRAMMVEMFPGKGNELRPLSQNHPIWVAKHRLDPRAHPFLGIQFGNRTAVIYSPAGVSCYWNQAHHDPTNPAVVSAVHIGQNIVDYVTGRRPPPETLSVE
jgi:hypothetical protein